MLQHTGLEVFEHSSQYKISHTILDTRYLKKIHHSIFLKIVRYEPDTDTNTDIITALILLYFYRKITILQIQQSHEFRHHPYNVQLSNNQSDNTTYPHRLVETMIMLIR